MFNAQLVCHPNFISQLSTASYSHSSHFFRWFPQFTHFVYIFEIEMVWPPYWERFLRHAFCLWIYNDTFTNCQGNCRNIFIFMWIDFYCFDILYHKNCFITLVPINDKCNALFSHTQKPQFFIWIYFMIALAST